MSEHTSFKIGGAADLFCIPTSTEDFVRLISLIRERKQSYFVLGNGSNILVSDKGIRGVVIDTTALTGLELSGTTVKADCGTELETLTQFVGNKSLTGLEFAYGIPGTVGGAVTMNAGAYGGEIKDVLTSVTVLTSRGKVLTLSNEKMQFAYRQSIVQQSDMIVLSAQFELKKGVYSQIKERMEELHEQRWTKQPMDLPSGGSVFKRPEGHYTGQLVDECSLRCYRIGCAGIS
jgi:UDP-N-acetylmuramate dehydrogenase